MGQSQSQPPRATTPEPDIDPAERARIQAEDRARRAAAVEQRLAAQQPRRKPNGMKLRPSDENKNTALPDQASSAESQRPAATPTATTTNTIAPKATTTPAPISPRPDVDDAASKLSELTVDEKEDRARRAAAMEKRLAAQQKRGNAGPGAPGTGGAGKKKLSPLEQLSRENKGWRDADEMADLRAWN